MKAILKDFTDKEKAFRNREEPKAEKEIDNKIVKK
jgi:hypothetical protein